MNKRNLKFKNISLAVASLMIANGAVSQTLPKQYYQKYNNNYIVDKTPFIIKVPNVNVEHTEVTLLNKTYHLDVFIPGLIIGTESLQITGDGILVAFRNTTGPIRPYVLGNVVYFGGHEFEVLPGQDEYRINTETYKLTKNVAYSFVDGEFTGIN